MQRATPAGGPGRWGDRNTPKAGWHCISIEDLDEPSATCEMCGIAVIRYSHVMGHADCPDVLRVGCVCASKMERDPKAAIVRERAMKSRAGKLDRWMRRTWRTSARGNPFLKVRGWLVVLYRRSDAWYFSINGRPSRYAHRDQDEAKRAAFAGLEWMRQRRESGAR